MFVLDKFRGGRELVPGRELVHHHYSNVEKKMYCRHCLSVYGPLALKIRHKASSKFSGHKFDKYMHGPLVQGSDNFALTFFF